MNIDRISACTYAVRTDPLDPTFAMLWRSGFRCVDLWGGLPNYANDPGACDIPGIKRKAAAHGLRIANLGTYPGQKLLEVGHEAEMREMKWALDNAVALGARSIRVHPGSGEDAGIVPSLIPFFTEAARYAEARKVYMGIENHQGSISGNPDAVMKLIRAVGSPWLGILFEPANLMHCKVDYRAAYGVFRGSIVHLHLKDGRWVGDSYQLTMLGEGDVDCDWVIRTLEADGYQGHYALEFEIEGGIPIAEGLPKWFSYIRAL